MELTGNKKYVLILMFVLFLIILIIFFAKGSLNAPRKEEPAQNPDDASDYLPFPNPPNKIYPVTEQRCKNQKEEKNKADCFTELAYNNAIKNQEPDECLVLADGSKKDSCLFVLAKMKLEIGLCEKVIDGRRKELCTIETAIASYDYGACDKYFSGTPFLRKKCKDKVKVFDIIDNKKDIKLCQEIRLLEYGPLCYSYMLQQGQSCDSLGDNRERLICQGKVVINTAKTEEDCQKAISETYKKVCMIMVSNGGDHDIDSDNDGKSNFEELNYRIDPFDPDTDGDGLKDGEEIVKYHSDPGSIDTDLDGLNDYDEIFIYGTNIDNTDTDNDGYSDGEEVKNGYNPLGDGKLK